VRNRCEWCSEMFEAKTARKRFCSPNCRYKAYYHSHPEYRKAQICNSQERLARDPDARDVVLEAGRRWREVNREAAREATRRWYRNNKEHCARKGKEWWDANPEKRKEYRDRWKENNPERIREFWTNNTYRRRALKAEADGSFTYAEFIELCELSNWECAYCGCDLDPETATADHVIPLSRGGSNGIDNIAPCCQSCNSSKRDKTAEEFMAYVAEKEVRH